VLGCNARVRHLCRCRRRLQGAGGDASFASTARELRPPLRFAVCTGASAAPAGDAKTYILPLIIETRQSVPGGQTIRTMASRVVTRRVF
jgi:hypothetical protein